MEKVTNVGCMTHVGRVLRQYRMEHNLLLKDMAAAMGVDSSWLANIETGRRSIPKGFVELVSSTFRMTPLELRDLKNAVE